MQVTAETTCQQKQPILPTLNMQVGMFWHHTAFPDISATKLEKGGAIGCTPALRPGLNLHSSSERSQLTGSWQTFCLDFQERQEGGAWKLQACLTHFSAW